MWIARNDSTLFLLHFGTEWNIGQNILLYSSIFLITTNLYFVLEHRFFTDELEYIYYVVREWDLIYICLLYCYTD